VAGKIARPCALVPPILSNSPLTTSPPGMASSVPTSESEFREGFQSVTAPLRPSMAARYSRRVPEIEVNFPDA
jgi:hypothetical protein